MDTSLDELLSDEPNETPVEAVEESAPALEQPRDEHGRFVPKETGVEPEPTVSEEVPPTSNTGLPKEDYKAIREEREKRQALERELEVIRQQLQAQQNPPEPPPSLWEDEQGWQQHFGSQVVSTAVQQATLNAKLDMSEMMVRQANPDFEEAKVEFLELAKENPQLVQQALADPHPWNKAYQIAKTHRTMREVGATDVETLKAKLREELMAEMQAQPPVSRQGIPPSLTTERNVGSRSGPAWNGPRSLNELLG